MGLCDELWSAPVGIWFDGEARGKSTDREPVFAGSRLRSFPYVDHPTQRSQSLVLLSCSWYLTTWHEQFLAVRWCRL